MSKSWLREHQKDPYYRSAKAIGYRARSAFKLLQIQEKFHIIKGGDAVVDLGAAPGGWTQVALEIAGPRGTVIGVDLAFIKPVIGATFIRGDMTARTTVLRVLERIEERAGKTRGAVDCVISDMSPNISGNYTMDQARSAHLCIEALRFATSVLRPGGNFVAKIFEGEDFIAFRNELTRLFHKVRTFSPPASRKESSEVYIVASDFKGGSVSGAPASGQAEPTEAWWDETDDGASDTS